MRKTFQLALVGFAMGCSKDSPTESNSSRLAPPSPSVGASARVISSGGAGSLELSTSIANRTTVHFLVSTGAQCPFPVRLFSDPTGEFEFTSLDTSWMQCPAGQPTIDLAPGDSVVLKRVLPADSLVSFAPGLYGINVSVATDRAVIGAWGGTVRLPLAN